MDLRCIVIGAGNLGTQLSIGLKGKGYQIMQVFSRTESSAKILAQKVGAACTIHPGQISNDADIYLIALKDSALDETLQKIEFSDKLIVHCAGSVPMSILEKYSNNYGVIYPVQTFSKEQEVDFSLK